MEPLGISLGNVIVLIFNFGIILGWPIASILALFALRRRRLPEIARVLWAILIIATPYLGVNAFLILNPDEQRKEYSEG